MRFERRLVNTGPAVRELANRVAASDRCGMDTESSGPNLYEKSHGSKSMLNVHRSSLTGISVALPDGTSSYVPIAHKRGGENAPLDAVASLFEALICSGDQRVYIHNLDHELHSIRNSDVPNRHHVLDTLERCAILGHAPTWRCTLVQSWLLNISRKGMYGLKSLAPELFGIEMSKFSEVVGQNDFSQLRPVDGLDYACEDAEVALLLGERCDAEMAGQEKLLAWYEDVELPFVWLVNEMERNGVRFLPGTHQETIDYLQAKYAGEMRDWRSLGLVYPELEKTYKRVEGPPRRLWLPVSPTSSQHLQSLYETGIWPTEDMERTKTGWTTKREAIEQMMERLDPESLGFRAAELRCAITGTKKLLSTYGEKLYGMAGSHADGRIRDSFKQAGTRTGRMSSSLLLLVPKHSEDGKRIRESFGADEGKTLVGGDFSQIELRILAHFARGGALYDGFLSGADPHQATADRLGRPRPFGKKANFSMIYGAGPGRIAADMRISLEEATQFLEDVNALLSDEVATLDRAEQAGLEHGRVRTLGGRFRPVHLKQALYRKRMLYKEGHRWTDDSDTYRKACRRVGREKRIARNTPIQGGAADVMKAAALRYWRAVDRSRAKVVLQIHDDLVSEVDDDYVDEACEIKRRAMEGAWDLRVPLEVDIRTGKVWSEL